jgi:hypothetical protein
VYAIIWVNTVKGNIARLDWVHHRKQGRKKERQRKNKEGRMNKNE